MNSDNTYNPLEGQDVEGSGRKKGRRQTDGDSGRKP